MIEESPETLRDFLRVCGSNGHPLGIDGFYRPGKCHCGSGRWYTKPFLERVDLLANAVKAENKARAGGGPHHRLNPGISQCFGTF